MLKNYSSWAQTTICSAGKISAASLTAAKNGSTCACWRSVSLASRSGGRPVRPGVKVSHARQRGNCFGALPFHPPLASVGCPSASAAHVCGSVCECGKFLLDAHATSVTLDPAAGRHSRPRLRVHISSPLLRQKRIGAVGPLQPSQTEEDEQLASSKI